MNNEQALNALLETYQESLRRTEARVEKLEALIDTMKAEGARHQRDRVWAVGVATLLLGFLGYTNWLAIPREVHANLPAELVKPLEDALPEALSASLETVLPLTLERELDDTGSLIRGAIGDAVGDQVSALTGNMIVANLEELQAQAKASAEELNMLVGTPEYDILRDAKPLIDLLGLGADMGILRVVTDKPGDDFYLCSDVNGARMRLRSEEDARITLEADSKRSNKNHNPGLIMLQDGAKIEAALQLDKNNVFSLKSRSTGTPIEIDSNGAGATVVGDLSVTGTLSKGGGTFRIDHPLEPEHKYLSHSFVESPDRMNVYNGNVVTNSDGRATIELPDWFGALNGDFRYQLTSIGGFARATVLEGIRDNEFTIATDSPGVQVSWQVTGIRRDPWALAHPLQVESEKSEAERGVYLHPEVYKARVSTALPE